MKEAKEISELRKLPKVENMTSSNGNDVPNQFLIYTENGTVFQSYSTIIALRTNGNIYLDENSWDYSTTTGKYRNQFLGMDKKETEKAIKNGRIKLVNLNR